MSMNMNINKSLLLFKLRIFEFSNAQIHEITCYVQQIKMILLPHCGAPIPPHNHLPHNYQIY